MKLVHSTARDTVRVARGSRHRVEVGPLDCCELFAAGVLGREKVLKHDLGLGIAIRVDERFVNRVGPEFGGVRRRQRIDVQDQDCPVWMIRLLERVMVGNVDPRVHGWRREVGCVEMICHALPLPGERVTALRHVSDWICPAISTKSKDKEPQRTRLVDVRARVLGSTARSARSGSPRIC